MKFYHLRRNQKSVIKMSQQKVDIEQFIVTGQRENSIDELNQNQMGAAGVVANGEPQPAVFKLDADCWDEVFDFLSLVDVTSFGQTCKAFERVAGKYFLWKYEGYNVEGKDGGVYIGDQQMNGFSEFLRILYMIESTDDSMVRFVESNCKAVKDLSFLEVDFNRLNLQLVENVVRKIEELGIFDCKFNKNAFEPLIQSCTNLKRMRVWCDTSLPLRMHPTLEHLSLKSVEMESGELTTFLKLSPKLQSIEISSGILLKHRDSVLKVNIALDDLAILMDSFIDENIVGLLKELHQRGFYKKLHLHTNGISMNPFNNRGSPSHYVGLPGLVTLHLPYGKNCAYPVLADITELGINAEWDFVPVGESAADYLSSRYSSIEQLFLNYSDFSGISSFIRRLMKLREIHISGFDEGSVLDIVALNKERKKLNGARKVTIYVDESLYLTTKWVTSTTALEMIELKRNCSREIIRPNSFRLLYRV